MGLLGLLGEVGVTGAGQDLQRRVRDPGGEQPRVAQRGEPVLATVQHERGRLDPWQPGVGVVEERRPPVRGQPTGTRPVHAEQAERRADLFGVRPPELLGEQRSGNHLGPQLGRRRAGGERRGSGWRRKEGPRTTRCGGPQDEPPHPVGETNSHLLGDHAPHRQAVDVGAVDVEGVEQGYGVTGQLRDGAGSPRRFRPAGAAVVVADAVEFRGVGRQPPGEHLAADGEPGDQQQRLAGAVPVIVQAGRRPTAADLNGRHPQAWRT